MPFRNSQQAAAAAHTSWSKTIDRDARTAPGLAAARRAQERQVDPHGLMTEADRAKAVHNAKVARALKASMAAADKRGRKAKDAAVRQAGA
jgi:hypothetical protein